MSFSAPPTAPATQQPISLDLLDVARFIRQRPDYHQSVNRRLLPHLYANLRDLLVCFDQNITSLNRTLTAIKANEMRGHERETAIGVMESYLSFVEDGFLSVWIWLNKIEVIMEVLGDSGSLTDGNRATFEDLQRLTRDFEDEIERVTGEVDGLG